MLQFVAFWHAMTLGQSTLRPPTLQPTHPSTMRATDMCRLSAQPVMSQVLLIADTASLG